MSARAILLSTLVLALISVGAWSAWRASPTKAAKPKETPPPAAEQAPDTVMPMVAPSMRPAPKSVQNPRDTSLMTRLPDGTYTPNLNGVREPMTWRWRGPFSPIVGVNRTDLGVDWWVHENGMQSTVVIVEGTMRGVPIRQAMLQVAVPSDNVLPVAAPTDAAKKN